MLIELSHLHDENPPWSLTCKGGSFEPLELPSYAPGNCPMLALMPNQYTRGAIRAINLNFISSLKSFQNGKCKLTADHRAVENIVLFSHFFPSKLCSLRLYFIVRLWSFRNRKYKLTIQSQCLSLIAEYTFVQNINVGLFSHFFSYYLNWLPLFQFLQLLKTVCPPS